jgi:hypothetical protein
MMQTQSDRTSQPELSIQELEQIEAAIHASQRWLSTLQGRCETLTAELERLTRPQMAPIKPAMKLIGPGVDYLGKLTRHWSYIDIHLDLLRRLWIEYPERRDAMALAMGAYGDTRAYVARTVAELFPGQSLTSAQRYSRQLVDGWYADTNLNRERMRRILPAAVRAAGLKWGQDVRVYWRATHVAIDD